ncbi:aspartate carbamoyltransferase catalytic subunit [Rubrobacter marinus]|uniref:Aspartate carbamoyltransferase n=1 Tax=Rubrobacter marinus TaxID=2653852 RepID=A0A6G8PXB6_9ACTN|nr:aspartate carbamoyltransferase catalytic subunit [Rubrobacter marinus]QIN78843.1 aspartate carbamoyltransferase catalytic subunit [Rubrobacter marinus]
MRARNLLSLEETSRAELREVLDLAREHAAGPLDRPLAGKTVCLAFFEASTRTAVSFELAARRAGADVISLSEKGSSLEKGEGLIDTVVTLDSLGADAIVLRHPAAGAARIAALHTGAAVVNAGDGRGQHPTQALLDLHALSDRFGGFDELIGRRVAVVGDVLHSRVARSVIPAFRAAGMELAIVAPRTLLPLEADAWGLPVLPSVDDAIDWGADVLYALRLQKERMTGGSPRVPSVPEYARYYGVAKRHLAAGALVMHPGPVNRGVEVAGDVVLDASSLIPDQVGSGVAVRSAVLALTMGAVPSRVAA